MAETAEARISRLERTLSAMEARVDAAEDFAGEFRSFMHEFRRNSESLAVLVERNLSMVKTMDNIVTIVEAQRSKVGSLESQMSVMQLVRAIVVVAVLGIASMAGTFVWTAATKSAMLHREVPTEPK